MAEQDLLRTSGLVNWYKSNTLSSSCEYSANIIRDWDYYSNVWANNRKDFSDPAIALRSF